VSIFILPFVKTTEVAAANLINLRHEAGNLSEYTTSSVDGGDLSIAREAALGGSGYGMKILIDDQNGLYAYKLLSSPVTSGIVRYRVYLDPNSITMPIDSEHTFVVISDISGNPVSLVLLKRTTSNTYGIYAVSIEDTGNHHNSQIYTISDAPHYIEVLTVRASSNVSNDGYTRFWVDGQLAYTTTPTDNFDQMADYQNIIVGAPTGIDVGTSGTFFVDEILVNNSGEQIGPAGSTNTPSPVPTFTPTATPTRIPTSTPTPTTIQLLGDINKDGIVNLMDYILLSNAFGTNNTAADINKDGLVNLMDYIILSNNFGKTL
jgi:hypothetical protein